MKFTKISDRVFGILCTVPGLIALVALVGYPILYSIVVSFLRYNNIQPNKFIGLNNYQWFFSSSDFLISWKVSAIYSLGSAGLAFLVGMILAHALKRITFGKGFFRTLIILPWAMPLILSGLVWKWMFNQDIGIVNFFLSLFHLTDTNIPWLIDSNLALLSGIIATAYVYIPFTTVLINAGLQNISPELYEAAEIDGADEIQKFWHITVHLNKPQMIFAFIIVWMFTFRTPDVFFSLTKGGPGKATYHAGLYLMDSIYRYLNFGHGAVIGIILAFSVAIVVGPIVLYLVRKSTSRK